MGNNDATDPEATYFFDGIPKTSTIQSPSPLPAAALVVPGDANSGSNAIEIEIEIGPSSRVIPNRNALVVGRQVSSCDIRIAHKSLSRQHALLYYDSAHLYAWDLNTKAGTLVNRTKIRPSSPVELNDGDTIQFGKAQPVLTVRWDRKEDENKKKENSNKNKNNNNNDDDGNAVGVTSDRGSNETETLGNPSKESEGATTEKSTEARKVEEDNPMEGLTGRERRRAEIAAMMASLDETPTYSKYVPTATSTTSTTDTAGTQQEPQNGNPTTTTTATEEGSSQQRKKHRILEKHRIPLTECTDMSVMDTSHVSTSAMDPTGARFAIGSTDSTLKLYDFAGYNILDPIPFQNLIVEDGYPIRSMSYSSDGSSILIGTGSAQPRVFDRDGQELVTFVRGDVYVRDPSKTVGHTAAVTSVGWHPLESSIVFSTSRDGSLRSWNIDKGKLSFGKLNCSDVVVIKHLRTGRMTIPTCLAVSPNTLAIGTECGSLQIYKYPLVSKLRPQQSVQVSTPDADAETKAKKEAKVDAIVSLIYALDATKIAVRTKREVTVWNTASRISVSTPPWMKYDNLPLHDDDIDADSSTPTMAFSPNGKILCIATNEKQDGGDRKHAYRKSLELFLLPNDSKPKRDKKYTSPIFSLPLLDGEADTGSILSLSWHHKLNQLLVTTQKGFQVFYSTEWSKNGILLTSRRRKKRKNVEESLQDLYAARAPPPGTAIRQDEIVTPNALPLFSGDKNRAKSKKQRAEEEHQDSVARHIPQQPSKGVFNTGVNMFTQMIMDDRSSHQKRIAGMDPREALAEYSEGKSFIGKAYEGNVERILTEKTMEQEQDEMNGTTGKKK